MKHFLKPLGHCLTTAVMTSAMLRVYALPAVEAATPDATANLPSTASEAAPSPSDATLLASPDLSVPTQEIAPPEVIAPLETAPAAVQAVETPAPVESAAPAVEPDAKPAEPEPSQVAKPSVETPTSAPDVPAGSADKPAASEPSTVNSTIDSTPNESKAPTEPSLQKAKSGSNARTVAGMRQVLEKRLAEIVERDKPSRTAQWLQNVTMAALQYAWQGQFEQARQIAANPTLPSDVQADLLGKIAAIETQRSAQIAQQPNQTTNQLSKLQANQARSGGRNVPSGYPTVGTLPSLPSYAEFSLGNQCPANRPVSAAPAAKTAKATARTSSPRDSFPAFLPALGENLATRLAQLNGTQTAKSPVAKPSQSANLKQPIVAPQLFVGVAASSFQSKLVPQQPTAPASLETAAQSHPKVAHTHIATLPGHAPAQQVETASSSVDLSLDQMVGSTLSYSFQQVGIPLSWLISDPLNLAWDWWRAPSSDKAIEPLLGQSAVSSIQMDQVASSFPGTITAEFGLGNNPLLQTLEQDLAAALQPARDGQKLSIPSLPLKAATAKTPAKAPTYDAAALLAVSCANAQLAHYDSGSYTIDPGTSKRLGWINMMYPLPIPAVVTSVFGWRVHPISGNLSFHTGLDIGAPMGTPVLSALAGRVVAADYMGGYGLAVVVENEAKQRNLYGHLSGIAVQPGAQVAQGTVLGWVGSTGNSTGPHLHFESLVHTEDGWTAIDPLASATVSLAQGRQQ